MAPLIIDTHCHLTDPRFEGDLAEVIARAREAGIFRAICIGTGIADGVQARLLAKEHANFLSCSVGLDPFSAFEAGDTFDERFAELEILLRSGDFCAVGEIGLDYFHPLGEKDIQIARFERQLVLANACDLPVIIHVRDAHADMKMCLQRHARVRGVIHSFTGTPQDALDYLALGFYLSINGMVTFKNNELLRAALSVIPIERLLLETDSPYLAPVPMRGRRCEPAFTAHTLATVAALRAEPLEVVATATTANALQLFRLSDL